VTTGFFVGSGPPEPGGRRSSSSCEAYREWIELELSRGRNATGIFQDLVDRHGFTGSYESVKRFVRKLRGQASPEARSIIETRPGAQCQMDYGTGPLTLQIALASPARYRRYQGGTMLGQRGSRGLGISWDERLHGARPRCAPVWRTSTRWPAC